MKLIPTPPRAAQERANTEDAVGLGIEAAVIVALFLGFGYLIDRLAGTMPIFMIVMTVLGAVGLFAKLKYRYDEKMDQHAARRADGSHSAPPTAPPTAPSDAAATEVQTADRRGSA
jgi:F0F1-type ATP synthase assembly protein I